MRLRTSGLYTTTSAIEVIYTSSGLMDISSQPSVIGTYLNELHGRRNPGPKKSWRTLRPSPIHHHPKWWTGKVLQRTAYLHVYISLPTHRADALRWTNIITSLGSCCVSRLEGRFRLFREEKWWKKWFCSRNIQWFLLCIYRHQLLYLYHTGTWWK
jgi:hypothetical protein